MAVLVKQKEKKKKAVQFILSRDIVLCLVPPLRSTLK